MYIYVYISMYISIYIYIAGTKPELVADARSYANKGKGCEEKHSNTTAQHPVVKPPAAASTAV